MKYQLRLLAASAVLFPLPASAQLLSQRADGQRRVCVYAAQNNVVSGQNPREYRVGLAQNCPMTPPPATAGIAPPTAQFVLERLVGETRECVYEQAGMRWTRGLPTSRQCPLSYGMIQDQPVSRGRRGR